jgi:hypothetical protein
MIVGRTPAKGGLGLGLDVESGVGLDVRLDLDVELGLGVSVLLGSVLAAAIPGKKRAIETSRARETTRAMRALTSGWHHRTALQGLGP